MPPCWWVEGGRLPAEPFEQPPAEPPPAEPPQPEVPVEEPAPAASEASTAAALIGIVDRIAGADRYSRQREQIIEQSADESFDCAVEITKIERTYSYIPDARFRKGRTVTGKLRGTDCEVTVELVAARNDEIDALKPGGLLRAKSKPVKWNTIYDRLEMREA